MYIEKIKRLMFYERDSLIIVLAYYHYLVMTYIVYINIVINCVCREFPTCNWCQYLSTFDI